MSAGETIDWTDLPAPIDDGAAAHLVGLNWPAIALPSTARSAVDISALDGLCVVYAYPMTGRPDQELPGGWDMVPGARGCTPQSCAFRDHFAELQSLGASHVFGLSAQTTDYQREAAERLHLPFPLLSDPELQVARSLKLPTFEVGDLRLFKRLTLIIDSGTIIKTFYPVFPPDRNATEVAAWLLERL